MDDCSTDDTREWLDEEATKHSNLRIIKHTVNKRQGGGRNTGVKVAKGKYLLFIDHQAKYLNILCHLSLDTLPFMSTYFFESIHIKFGDFCTKTSTGCLISYQRNQMYS